jgi:acetyltransferase-like isoleucine patch superfamily enzyme
MIPKNIRFDALLYVCNMLIANFPSSSFRHFFYRYIMQVQIGEKAHMLSGVWLDCRGQLVLGERTVINQRCRLDARGGLTIGHDVSISPEVHILTADHDIFSPELSGRTSSVKIGDFVFIGSRAMILPGCSIGRGAVVAAGAVVTKDVEALSVVAGVPAREIAKRPDNFEYVLVGKRHFI